MNCEMKTSDEGESVIVTVKQSVSTQTWNLQSELETVKFFNF